MTSLKFIDLCCGIGGFHQALVSMGMQCVLAADIDKECRDNYKENYHIEPHGDLSQIDIKTIPDFDVLCSGFPCQPFSKAGFQNGFSDSRGNIFFDICKIISHHKPKYLILENVRNLASHDGGNTWNVIKETLCNLEYNTYDDPLILNTLYFGVPQSRERVVILCKRKDLGNLPLLPPISKKNIRPTSLESIVENAVDPKYHISGKMRTTHTIWNEFLSLLNANNIGIPRFPIWTDWWDSDGNDTTVTKYDDKKSEEENKVAIEMAQKQFYVKYKNWIDKNREFYRDNKTLLESWLLKSRKNVLWKGAVRKMEYQCGQDGFTMNDVLWSPRGSGIRIKKPDYAPTLVAMTSMIPIYKQRQLTPRECARLQSFPDSYKIHPNEKTAYKQFGNAVNVKMIEHCARFMINNESLF